MKNNSFEFPIYIPEEERYWLYLSLKDEFPERPAIYVVYKAGETTPLYIGETSNLKRRWNYDGKPHHVWKRLIQDNGYSTYGLVISYSCAAEFSNKQKRLEVEKRLINNYKPKFNTKDKPVVVENKIGLVKLIKK